MFAEVKDLVKVAIGIPKLFKLVCDELIAVCFLEGVLPLFNDGLCFSSADDGSQNNGRDAET